MSLPAAQALWAVGPGRCELRAAPLSPPGAGEVLVQAEVGAVSRGTERLVVHGRVPPSEHDRMRGPHMDGAFPFPVKYGYVSVGRVLDGAMPQGTRVFCLHPHQTHYVVPASDVVALPAATPPDRAVLAPNLETAINVVWDSRLSIGDRVAVVGGGVVGLLVAWLAAQTAGTQVVVVDLVDRRDVAASLGVAWSPSAEELGDDHDVVIEASGHPQGAHTALALAGAEATVVVASWFGDQEVVLPLGQAFHSRRLTLRSSQVGQLPPSHQRRWTYRRRMALALRLAAEPALDALFTHEVPFSELAERLPQVTSEGGGPLCVRVRYRT